MKYFILLFISMAVVSLPLGAQTEQAIRVSSMYYYFNYNEDVPAPLKSSETAWLPGGRVAFVYQGNADFAFYGTCAFEYTQGLTDYDGTTQKGESLHLKSKHTLMRGEVDLGLSVRHIGGSTVDIIPYIGLGYRYWQRDLGDTDPRGLREVYSWWYVPVGIRTNWSLDDSWDLGCDLSARIMSGGTIKFDFAHSDPSMNSPIADLGNEVAWKFSVPLGFRLSPQFRLEAELWYEHSSIGASNEVLVTQDGTPVLQYQEPSSSTDQVGVNVGVLFGF